MKIFLIVFLSFLTYNSYAQLNKTESEVMQLMAKDEKWTFDKKGIAQDGKPYLDYMCNTTQAISKALYFDDTNRCVFIRFVVKNEMLNDTIIEFNNKFSSKPDNTWIDHKNSTVYHIKLYPDEPIFDVLQYPVQ